MTFTERSSVPFLCAILAAACSQTPAPKPAAEVQKPTQTPAPSPTPQKAGAANLVDALYGGKQPARGPAEDEEGEPPRKSWEIVADPATGKRLVKIRKHPTWYQKNGQLFSAIVPAVGEGTPIVRQDESFYYVEAPPELTPEEIARRRAEREAAEAALPPIWELPKEEAEVVTPPVSKKRVRLEDLSAGLPKGGIWRDNFALADLDGDGRPEIVSPPPRLSGQGIRIFKWTGDRWKAITPQMENPEGLHVSYGGVAAGDLDGDGLNDIVWGGHGSGMGVAYNLGGFRFRVESRGLPRAISSRAVAVGDLDGDGREDILVVSDMPEAVQTVGKPRATQGGYIEGYDVRAYFNQGDRFAEFVSGFEENPCFGYSVALSPRPVDGGPPFFVSGCRYSNWLNVLWELDRQPMTFRNVSPGVAEAYSVHLGSAVGTYKKHPAAFVTYIKNTPGSAQPMISGDGVSIYFREAGAWKRKRVVKRVGSEAATSQGIAAGDLDGDGLDDVVFADNLSKKLRVFFQTPSGGFEELDSALEPSIVNAPSAVRIGDVDGDGRLDIVLMFHYLTGHETREGGFRFYLNLPSK